MHHEKDGFSNSEFIYTTIVFNKDIILFNTKTKILKKKFCLRPGVRKTFRLSIYTTTDTFVLSRTKLLLTYKLKILSFK